MSSCFQSKDFFFIFQNKKKIFFVLFFRRFGAGHCSESGFDDFLHVWRVIGYYLGVEDKFNPVKATYHETKGCVFFLFLEKKKSNFYVYFYFAELLWEIGNQIVIPSMLHLDTTAIHMAKCVTRAYNIDYHLSVYTHCYSKFKDTST